MHNHFIFHRDLKTSNLLYNNKGILKICDFGLAKHFHSKKMKYTTNVVTLWYRAPEVILGTNTYSSKIDIWSVACIMAELILGEPLFPGNSEMNEIDMIFKHLGTPTEQIWPDWKQQRFARKMHFTKHPPGRLIERF